MQYKLVKSKNKDKFSEEAFVKDVQAHLNDGWICQGQPVKISTYFNDTIFAQAMIKYDSFLERVVHFIGV